LCPPVGFAREAAHATGGSPALTATQRNPLVRSLLANPPNVHDGIASGVWSTQRYCYELIGSVVGPGSRTLETGLGISTALFASIGTTHICVVPRQEEVDRLIAHCEERGIDHRKVTFLVAPADEVLPSLRVEGDLDLVLIDGSHGYRASVIDW
jgi:hypothetical protein